MKSPLSKRIPGLVITALLSLSAANAQIIYTDVNPDSVIANQSYNLDLDNDGITDFILHGSLITIRCGRTGMAREVRLSIAPAKGNNDVMTDGTGFAIALLNGSAIVPDSQWSNTSQVLYSNQGTACLRIHTGHWTASNTDQYLGLRFTKNNNVYLGWARVTWDGVLKDYAYNNAAGEPIFAGQGASTVFPQTAPAIQWQKSLGGNFVEVGNCIRQTTDGGFIAAGSSDSNDGDVSGDHGGEDGWIVKLNSTGSIVWQKCIGGSSDDDANSIVQTSDGGYIVAGFTHSNDGDVSGNHGQVDGWIVKINSTGTIEWQKCIGGSTDEVLHSVVQTADGGYIVAGETYSNDGDVSSNHGDDGGWIVKLNSTGMIEWQKCLGGSGVEEVSSIIQTVDGGFIAAGSSGSNDGDVSSNQGQIDWWVIKLNGNGAIEWQKNMGGSFDDFAISIQQTTDGGYIVAGSAASNDGDVSGNHGGGGGDGWLIKLSNTGTIEWNKVFGSNGIGEEFYSVWQTTDGGYIAGGSSVSNDGDVSGNHGGLGDYWLVKFNSKGEPQWQKCLGGSALDMAYSIQQTTDGGYIVSGYAESNDGDVSGNHGYLDCWIVKLGRDVVLPLRLLSFNGTLKNTTVKLSWQTTNEINTKDFIVERSSDAKNFSTIGKVNAQISSAITNSYNYTDDAPLPGINYYRLKMEDRDGKFSYSGVIKINYNKRGRMTITPNPVVNTTTISFAVPQSQKAMPAACLSGRQGSQVSIQVFDMSGRLIKTLADEEMQAGAHQLTWNARDEKGNPVSTGIYLLKMQVGNYAETKKLVVVK